MSIFLTGLCDTGLLADHLLGSLDGQKKFFVLFCGFLSFFCSFFVGFCLFLSLLLLRQRLLRLLEVLLLRRLRVHALRDRAYDLAHVRDGIQRVLVHVRVEADSLLVDEAVQHRIKCQIVGDNLNRLLLRGGRDHRSRGGRSGLLSRLRRCRLRRDDGLPLRSWHLLGLLGLLALLGAR